MVNAGSLADEGQFIPYQVPNGVSVANETLTFSYDAHIPEPTPEVCAQVFVLTSNGGINEAVLANRGVGLGALRTKSSWWDTASDADIGNAASEAFAESITVPGYVSLITAIGVAVQNDAVPTAEEHLMGYLELSGTIPALDPMKVPFEAQGPTDGTSAENHEGGRMCIYPLHIPGTKKNETIDITAVIESTLSGVTAMHVTLFGI